MKRLLTTLMVLFFIILASIANADPSAGGFKFNGLWQGVDLTDGSEVLRSIIKNDDGTFDIIGSETYFTGCSGGRGIVTGTGVLEAGVLVSSDFTLKCYEVADYGAAAEFVPDKRNGTLKEMYEGSDFPPVILHRISK